MSQRPSTAPARPADSYPWYFVDIETVPVLEPSQETARLYEKKFKRSIEEMVDSRGFKTFDAAKAWHYQENAALYAEFCEIVSVSIGKITTIEQGLCLKVKNISAAGALLTDEKAIITEFSAMISKARTLVAHNGKEFDFPMLYRRMLIKNIPIPPILAYHLKSWDYPFEDTMDIWSHSAWKNKTSLDLLASVFGIPSSKTTMDGKQVSDVYYSSDKDKHIKIRDYNNSDVVALTRLFLKLKQIDLVITDEQIVYV